MNKRYISINAYSLCAFLLIPTLQTFSADGTSGWAVSMAKTAGTFALKAIGAGILGGSVLDTRQQQRLSDKWNGTKTPTSTVPTGSAREEAPRGLESSSISPESSSSQSSKGIAREIRNGEVIEYYNNSQSALNGYRDQYRNQTTEQLQSGIQSTQSIVQSAQAEVNYRRKTNDKKVLKEAEDHLNFWQQILTDQQSELNARKSVTERSENVKKQALTTVTQATALILTTQTAGTASTEKASPISTEEKNLYDLIKAREAQSKQWQNAFWPSQWVSIATAREYEKGTQEHRDKLAAFQKERWEPSRQMLHKHESERQKEVSQQIIGHRNNGGGGSGGGKEPDKDPKKDPNMLVQGAGMTAGGKAAQELEKALTKNDKPFKREPQKIDPEKNRPNHETGNPLEWHEQEAKRKHIWRDEGGHVPKETETAKDMFNDIAQKPENHLGQNKAGNQVYAGPNKIDGKQAYVKVREGKVENAGVNDNPWTKEQILGTETPPRDKGNSNQYAIIGGGVGALASTTTAEASQSISSTTLDKIKNDPNRFEIKVEEFTLPPAPANQNPHFTTQSNGPDFKIPKLTTEDFTKHSTGATSNKDGFIISTQLIEKIKNSPLPKVSDTPATKTSAPTFTLPPAPTDKKSFNPSSITLPTVPKPSNSKPIDLKPMPTPKLTLPTSSKTTATPPSTPRSTPTYRPSAPTSRPSVPSFKPSGNGSGFGKRN